MKKSTSEVSNDIKLRPIVLIGTGGHARVVHDLIKISGGYLIAVVDPQTFKDTYFQDLKHISDDDEVLNKYSVDEIYIANGIGMVPGKNIKLRKKLYMKYKKLGFYFPPLIHPSSAVSEYAKIKEGAQVMAGSVIQAATYIGENAIINTSASIDHDCYIEAHVHIAPGVTMCGNVKVKENSFVGAGSVVLPSYNIKKNSFVKGGSILG